MWVYGFTLYLFFKCLSWPKEASWSSKVIYLLVWPGMDPKVLQKQEPAPVRTVEWVLASAKLALGLLLLWVLPPYLPSELRGWAGIFGLIFSLHFGIFHLIALWLRRRGYPVKRIMNAPLFAKSVAEFWGKRWNMAFRDLAHSQVFSKLTARFGAPFAIVATFLFSGFLHEIVISLPIKSGFGGPTLYFLIQAVAMLMERKGLESRAFTLVVTLLPAPILFHSAFLNGVMVPFLKVIGGLP
jgi:alginate O-acetyltransferase complex protein AlgI